MTGDRRPLLEARGLRVRRGDGFVLEVPELTLAEGEILALIGPNGAGKTTLLLTLCGLLAPEAGELRFHGRTVDPAGLDYRRRVTMAFQDPLLLSGTVADNIAAGLKFRGLAAQARRDRVADSLDRFQIAALRDRPGHSLSGGEARRVSLARAFALQPELLFLDEPLISLDPHIRRHILEDLEGALSHSRLPLIFTTHDHEQALALADRMGVMLAGKLQQVGTPDELFWRPSDPEVSRFLGLRNVFPAKWVRDGVCLCSGVEVHAAQARGTTGHVWIRPEEVLLSAQAFDSSARNQLPCRVLEWRPHGGLLEVCLSAGPLELSALVTFASFERLKPRKGSELFATFKSSAVHCF